MDAKRFDAISRVLGTESRRRGMLKAVAGGALGLVGLSRLTDSALARTCTSDNDCNGNDVCDNDNNECVECTKDNDCDGKDVCDNDNKCVECTKDNDCDGKDVCDKDKCVECTKNKDCQSDERCDNNKCKQE